MTATNGPNLKLLVNAALGEEYYAPLCALLRGLDGLIMPRVLSRVLTAPPTIADGAMYIIPPSATGAWASKTGQIARGFTVGVGAPGWEFFTPLSGWAVSVVNETDSSGAPTRYVFDGTTWDPKILISHFTDLSDVPPNYTGSPLYSVRVNAAANALEFFRPPAVVSVAWNGVPTSGQRIGLFVAPYAIDFAAALAGSSGIALTAATAQTDITVNKIAASGHTVTAVGTVRFAAAGAAPTFIAASAFSLAAGDALEFKAPGTADLTLADFSFSIVGAH
jgi:hypothetical protein